MFSGKRRRTWVLLRIQWVWGLFGIPVHGDNRSLECSSRVAQQSIFQLPLSEQHITSSAVNWQFHLVFWIHTIELSHSRFISMLACFCADFLHQVGTYIYIFLYVYILNLYHLSFRYIEKSHTEGSALFYLNMKNHLVNGPLFSMNNFSKYNLVSIFYLHPNLVLSKISNI